MRLEEIKSVKSLSVYQVTANESWAFDGRNILKNKIDSLKWEAVATVDSSLLSWVYSKSELLMRLSRQCAHNLSKLKSGTILVFLQGCIYRYEPHKRFITKVYAMGPSRRILPNGITQDESGNIYFGEYLRNPGRTEVCIYKSDDDGLNWESVYKFDNNTIRHIHSVQYDPYSQTIWVTTGDCNQECQIAYSTDGCKSFVRIGGGSQLWRAVSLVFTQDCVYWGTDNPEGENTIYSWQRKNAKLNKIASVENPVYYSKRIGESILFSTAVELSGKNKDNYARIYGINKNHKCQMLYESKKDKWHPKLFGYGVFEFSRGDFKNSDFWVIEKGLEKGYRSVLFKFQD